MNQQQKQEQLTLAQAVKVAATVYGKSPGLKSLQDAAKDGRLEARQVPVELVNRSIWVTTEEALAVYLEGWQPGRGAKPGERRAAGKRSAVALASIREARRKKVELTKETRSNFAT